MRMPSIRLVEQTHSSSPQSVQLHLAMLQNMILSRRLDDLEIKLKRKNEIYFQISGAGHEATQTAGALLFQSGYDWFFPYYRDRAFCLGIGVTPKEMLMQGFGCAADPASGGRQMPSHWGHKKCQIPSSSSPTGTQFLNAVGCAEASCFFDKKDQVTVVSSGEGTTSQGEFYEALNTACLGKLPLIFHIQDNGYAISVPVEAQTPGGSISELLSGYPNLLILNFDGCDPLLSYLKWEEAYAHARSGKGPVLLHAKVVRPYSHSMSDDERLYRSQKEIDLEKQQDPISVFKERLTVKNLEQEIKQIEADVEKELEIAEKEAREEPKATNVQSYVFSPNINPESTSFDAKADFQGSEKTMVELINSCLKDEMAKNEQLVVFGEDVADVSKEEHLQDLKGKGGVFKVTSGLQKTFGSHRVFNSPLAEANIVGRAVGMALRGIKPVVEIQFFDYIFPAMMQIRSELALMRWRSNNEFSCPVVIRTTYGGYLKGGAVYHSQTGESIFTHIPGLRVVLPSNALDANGLLRTAIRCEDPVLFLEHKHLYRQTYNRSANPGPDFTIPFGKAKCVREGEDLTIITYGALVKRSLDAAKQAQNEGVNVEILDLRTLSPFDWESIQASVKKTNRVIIAHEENLSWGFGAELASKISDELFEHLDAPVKRVASLDTFVGYHPNLEEQILPQINDIFEAIMELDEY